ncbi:MAG: CBS domain-containing protein, partial [Candidatus Eremiobacteraeota bacterium]|nr:CBS domain-containing protein [Candidatus Eremiobacteraeota bacterium]
MLADQLTAAQIMNQPAITIEEDAELMDIAQKMADHGVSGLVVIDSEGRAAGVVSDSDLLHKVAHTHLPPHVQLLGGVFFLEMPHRFRQLMSKLKGFRAKDLMNSPALSVEPSATAREIADLMQENEVRRVVVVADD